MNRPRRVLIIAYQFPPVGGAGVQRVTKFTKYLPQWGWDVSVLTVRNPSVPLRDSSLCQDVPEETAIHRVRSLEPGYAAKQTLSEQTAIAKKSWAKSGKKWLRRLAVNILQPDAQLLWVPNAIRAGIKLLRENPHDAIVVSGPPFSSFYVGAALKKRTGLPLVLDYRDEWSLSSRYSENRAKNRFANALQRRQQSSLIRRADALIATTEESSEALRVEASHANHEVPVHCIFNGFDPADFRGTAGKGSTRHGPNHRFTHVGTLWNLTSSKAWLSAVDEFCHRFPAKATGIELEFVGRSTPEEESAVEGFHACPLRSRAYVDHSTAIEVMRTSDELCLLLSDAPGADRVIPAKTFEYLASGSRIVAITGKGATANVLYGQPGVTRISPSNQSGIVNYLNRTMSASTIQGRKYQRSLSQYDRYEQAGQLSEVLNELACRS